MGGTHRTHEEINRIILLAENPERKSHLDDLDIDERIILK
jgi:hypothetical protein